MATLVIATLVSFILHSSLFPLYWLIYLIYPSSQTTVTHPSCFTFVVFALLLLLLPQVGYPTRT